MTVMMFKHSIIKWVSDIQENTGIVLLQGDIKAWIDYIIFNTLDIPLYQDAPFPYSFDIIIGHMTF